MRPLRCAGIRFLLLLLALGVVTVAGCKRKPPQSSADVDLPGGGLATIGESETGLASWYGDPYHGRRTANGEIYDKMKFTSAHRTLAFNTWVRVTNLENGRFTTVRINDRGPFIAGRIIDLSQAAADAIGMLGPGTALVRLDILERPEGEPSPNARFAVQVGAFLVRENADQLRQSLAAQFPGVFIETFDAPEGRFFRVRVPAQTEDEALRLAMRLNVEAGVTEAFVVRLN